jgi:hypothetical protein
LLLLLFFFFCVCVFLFPGVLSAPQLDAVAPSLTHVTFHIPRSALTTGSPPTPRMPGSPSSGAASPAPSPSLGPASLSPTSLAALWSCTLPREPDSPAVCWGARQLQQPHLKKLQQLPRLLPSPPSQ